MAKRSNSFNLSETIRDFRKGHRGMSANDALAAVKKAHPGQKINDGTFRATFYKLAGNGKPKKSVMRRKPGRGAVAGNHSEAVMKAGLAFIRLAGGVEGARERLAGLEKLIDAAKAVE
jgi:hypothetical protein